MGTNYFLVRNACHACGHYREEDAIHIGKRSSGWRFCWHALGPEESPTGDPFKHVEDWEAYLLTMPVNYRIFDEYGGEFKPQQFLAMAKEWGTQTHSPVSFETHINYDKDGNRMSYGYFR